MTSTIAINVDALAARLEGMFKDVAPQVEAAMAGRYQEIVLSNFGDFGLDRPWPWPLLTQDYARKVKRPHATLFVTGALFNAVQLDANRVFASNSTVPYATVHQFGGGNNIPARPYFPIDADGGPTPFTQSEVQRVAVGELARLIS